MERDLRPSVDAGRPARCAGGPGRADRHAPGAGIDDDFIRQLGQAVTEDSSALFVLFRKLTLDRVVPDLEKYQGTVLRMSLSIAAGAGALPGVGATPGQGRLIRSNPDAGIGLFEGRADVDAAG